jgi:hypothetical protein
MHLQQIHVQPPASPLYAGGRDDSPQYETQPYSTGMQLSPPAFTSAGPPQQQMINPEVTRPIFAPLEGGVPGVSRLLYHAPASEKVHCMHSCRGYLQPWTCACIPQVSRELARGRYVQVFDNKIEMNEPDSCCVGFGTCVIRDRISTIHFDRALVQNAQKAEGCGPNCSHGDCYPSCCGCYGETLVLYTDTPNCCQLCGECCMTVNTSSSVHSSNSGCAYTNCGDFFAAPPFSCLPCFPAHKLVFGLDNVADLALKINAARQLKGAPRAQPPF